MGYDLSVALGAAHGLEIPFVFGDFEGGFASLADFFSVSPGKDALSSSMQSYWSEFALNGDPGSGRDGKETPWLAWGTDGQRAIILDTVEGGGIRMMAEEVTAEGIKAELAADRGITDARERCRLYVINFGWPELDRAEYDTFGPDGCAQFDPMEFSLF